METAPSQQFTIPVPASTPPAGDVQCEPCSHPYTLVNGRGVEYFKLHSADSLLTAPLLPPFCLAVH